MLPLQRTGVQKRQNATFRTATRHSSKLPNTDDRMIGFKKLDIYILKKFLLLFAAAFCICIFVFEMQAAWKYIEDLVGKGLSIDILGKFFGYLTLYLVPQSLPLAVLLATLITFGNLGESLELLAMKAAGIPLIRVMRPLLIFAIGTVGFSFWFQNKVSAPAYLDMRTLLFSMKLQSPAVEIPEGVFYNGVPNINIYVQKKDVSTGMLYQTIIYKVDQGFNRAHIVLADSARLEMTEDKKNLVLDMWSGEQFESLQGNSAGTQMLGSSASDPYDRETFDYKKFIIDFDSNFNMVDKNVLATMAEGKDLKQLRHSIDSMNQAMDSVGKRYFVDAQSVYFRRPALSKADSVSLYRQLKAHPQNIDSLLAHLPAEKMQNVEQAARISVQSAKSDLEWKAMTTHDTDYTIRRHWSYWYMFYTGSIVCLIFFLIGASLGAIIRKGGLGFPVLISVGVFIIRYVIDTSTTKMARDGNINMMFAMWLSTVIITPLAIFLTYKANRDSGLFNMEAYTNAFRRLLGLRTKRHIAAKEVVIHDPDMERVAQLLEEIKTESNEYMAGNHLLKAPSYVQTFFRYQADDHVERISEKIEELVEELSNSRDYRMLSGINQIPVLYTTAHVSPFHSTKWNKAAGILFPVGIVLWLRIWRFRLILLRELKQIVRTCNSLEELIHGNTNEAEEENSPATDTAQKKKKRNWKKVAIIFFLSAAIAAAIGNWGYKRYRHYRIQKMMRMEQPGAAPAEGTALPNQGTPLSQPTTDSPFGN